MSLSDQDESSTSQTSVSDHEDRPMKKARYVWQIKGRYRFKQNKHRTCTGRSCSEGASLLHSSASPSSSPSSSGASSSSSSSSSTVQERCHWPQDVWQARQMAKAVVDNTVNRVIEDGGLASYVDDTNSWLDSSFEHVHATRDSAHLENAAVMMAIQSHGLQHPPKCTCPEPLQKLSSSPLELTLPFHQRPPSYHHMEGTTATESGKQTASDDTWTSSTAVSNTGKAVSNATSVSNAASSVSNSASSVSNSASSVSNSASSVSNSVASVSNAASSVSNSVASVSNAATSVSIAGTSPSYSTEPVSTLQFETTLQFDVATTSVTNATKSIKNAGSSVSNAATLPSYPTTAVTTFPSYSTTSISTSPSHLKTKSKTSSFDQKKETRSQSSFEFDFLEQAVAAAILKKGLITATTDHG